VQCAWLDVHELARDGKLKLGTHGWLFGAIWFEVPVDRMRGSWCWSFLANPPAAKRWIPYGRSFSAIGGKHILAGGTSCSRAPNATAQRAFYMLGRATVFGFSVAENAPISPTSLPWVIGGTARRVVSRSCALG
jgi:hypothetical protein